MLYPLIKCFYLYFRKNETFLNIGLLRIIKFFLSPVKFYVLVDGLWQIARSWEECFYALSKNCEMRPLNSCPSICPHGTTRLPLDAFLWNLIWVFLESLSRKFKFNINLSRIKCTLPKDQYTFLIISRSVLLRMKNIWDKFVEKIKTHILCSINSFRKSCRLWYNVGKYSRAGQAHRWQYGPCALNAVYLGLQTHTQVV